MNSNQAHPPPWFPLFCFMKILELKDFCKNLNIVVYSTKISFAYCSQKLKISSFLGFFFFNAEFFNAIIPLEKKSFQNLFQNFQIQSLIGFFLQCRIKPIERNHSIGMKSFQWNKIIALE